MKKVTLLLALLITGFLNAQVGSEPAKFHDGISLPNIDTDTTAVLLGQDNTGKVFSIGKTIDQIGGKTKLSEFVDDIGATEAITAFTIYVDMANGNDATAQIQNAAKPFKTDSAAYAAIPDDGNEWEVNFIGGNITRNLTADFPSRPFRLVSNSSGVFDFSNHNNPITVNETGKRPFKLLVPRAKVLIGGSNITIGAGGTTNRDDKYVIIDADVLEISSTYPTGNYSAIIGYNDKNQLSKISCNTLIANTNGYLFEISGSIEVRDRLEAYNYQYLNKNGDNQFTFQVNEFEKMNDDDLLMFSGTASPSTFSINKISGVGGELNMITYGGVTATSNINFNNLIIDPNVTVRIADRNRGYINIRGSMDDENSALEVVSGGSTTSNGILEFENFTGELAPITNASNYDFKFTNTTISFDNELFNSSEIGLVEFKGVNTLISSNSDQESLFIGVTSTSNVIDKGYVSTNVRGFGENINIIKTNATFKEKLGEQVVRSKYDLANKILDPETTFIVDGSINLLAGEYIYVPSTGNLTINGYGLEASSINKDVAGEAIFKSPAGGSGGLLMDGLKIISGDGSVFDLTDATGFNAVELVKVNFEDCASLGTLTGYRQSLWENIGLFGNSDGLTFEGTWLGGFRSETVIVRNMAGSTGTLFKKGASLTFESRFFTDANIDIPAGWKVIDFNSSNFNNPNTLQLQNMIVTRAGIIDDTDVLFSPNIDEEDSVCDWRGNVGIPNSSVEFQKIHSPNGTVYKIIVNDAGDLRALPN